MSDFAFRPIVMIAAVTTVALVTAALIACSTVPSATPAQSNTPSRITGATAAPYAPITKNRIQHQPVAGDVVELALSARQQALFVSAPDWQDESRSALLRLDPATLAVQARVPLKGKGFGVALDDQANRLYLTQGFNGRLAVVDTQHNQVLARIPLMEKVNFERAYKDKGFSDKRSAFLLKALEGFKITEDFPYKLREMVIDQRHHRVFAPGLGLGFDSVLFVVNTQTLTLEKTLPGFGYNAVGIALDEARNRLFVSNMAGQIMVVDTQTLHVTQTLEVEADQLLNLVYDPVGNRLFGVDQGIDRDNWRNNHLERQYTHRSSGHRFFVLDADTGKTIASLPTGQVPIGLKFAPQRQRMYVTNRGGVRVDEGKGSLTVFDTRHYRELQTIALPPHPNSMALAPSGEALYITLKNDANAKKAKQQESVVRIALL
ncbi:YncE family protein [Ottowia sp.]|uniref:YncE family protein n=1 Tax=Ottowia sp. TaxID=1898956 RepID=UPI003A85DCD7